MRALVVIVVVLGCGDPKPGASPAGPPQDIAQVGPEAGKPAPAKEPANDPKPPAVVADAKPAPVVVKGSDPEHDREVQAILDVANDGNRGNAIEGALGGALGDGLGAGSGAGATAPATSGVPHVSLGTLVVSGPGTLDRSIVRRWVVRNRTKLLHCYETELFTQPALGGKPGTVTLTFRIQTDGTVGDSQTSTGFSANVEACLARVVTDIEFPKPANGAVDVSQPLTFASK